MRRIAFAMLIALPACATTGYTGKVVSCADQKPLHASLKFNSSQQGGNMGEMPATTKDDGSYEASVTARDGNAVTLHVESDGYAPKDQPLTSGAPQTICLDKK
jgi:hypothetical protein